jgi:hypothetical protein
MKEDKQGEPWWPHCMRCAIKHSLGLEGHLTEAMERAVREKRDPAKFAKLLKKQAQVRKGLEEIYFSDEIMVELALGVGARPEEIKDLLIKALEELIIDGNK